VKVIVPPVSAPEVAPVVSELLQPIEAAPHARSAAMERIRVCMS
jgi:hypothetical protein